MSAVHAQHAPGRSGHSRQLRGVARTAPVVLAALAVAASGCGAAPLTAADRAAADRAARSALPNRLPRSHGATRYVALNGSDRARGTRSAPWRSVQKALNTLRPGQTAVVRAGVYRRNLVATRAGRRRAPITIRGEPGAVITISPGDGDAVPLTLEDGAAYLRFTGLVFEGATGDSTTNVYADHGAHDIELSRCEVRGSARQGFFSESDTRRIQILGCRFHDNGGQGPDRLDHNIYVEGSNHVIAGNLLLGARNGYGIQLYPSSDGVTIAGNTIVGNKLDGILIGGGDGGTTRNALVVNNIITGSKTPISTFWEGAVGTGNVVRDNLGWHNDNKGFRGSGAAWVGNHTKDPKFAGPGDYHLQDGSPALGRALQRLTLPADIEGRRRPQGDALPDLGAFER